MAIIHKATLSPSKLELIADYLPKQPWFIQDGSPELIGAYRFDDPAGEVGLETHVVTAGERVYQVPLSYRGYALAGAEEWLIGTMDHSVLGKRWVYDACADPHLRQSPRYCHFDWPERGRTHCRRRAGTPPSQHGDGEGQRKARRRHPGLECLGAGIG